MVCVYGGVWEEFGFSGKDTLMICFGELTLSWNDENGNDDFKNLTFSSNT